MFTLPAYLYRGGTSKCWLFCEPDLAPYAPDESELSRILSAALGGDDPREINGVGGATTTTSKAAVITPTPGADSHLSYTFAQVGIGDGTVEYGSNCGNCATAIGLFALDQGYAPIVDGVSEVRMYNTNTDTVLTARRDTGRRGSRPGRRPRSRHPHHGSRCGARLPRARGREIAAADRQPHRRIPGGDRHASATLVSPGAPAALFRASDLGRTGSETLSEMSDFAPTLATARRPAARAMGLISESDPTSHAVPKLGIVGPPADYVTPLDEPIAASDYDIAVRMLSMNAPHPAIGLTSAVAVAAAAATPGGTVAEVLGGALSPENNRSLRIGTPGGIVAVDVTFAADGSMSHVGLQRAARRIAQAVLSIPLSRATAVAG